MKSKDDNIDKKLRQERGMVQRDCLQSSPIKTFATHNSTVKRLQRKIDDTVERSTDNLPVEENEKLL